MHRSLSLALLLVAACGAGLPAFQPDDGGLPPDGGVAPGAADGGGQPSGADGGASSAGPAPASRCPVPDMLSLYGGPLPPNPYGQWVPAADACVGGAHDAIVLLGCPSNDDGTPSQSQQWRVQLGLELRDAGIARKFIVTGAAVHNQWVEARALHDQLVARGVPEADILLDPLARHTDENLYYASKILQAQGWESAVVVSDDPGQLIMTATCDANCCVALGRMTVVDFQTPSRTIRAGHYALVPPGAAVSGEECAQIERTTKAMCTNLKSRLACQDDFKL